MLVLSTSARRQDAGGNPVYARGDFCCYKMDVRFEQRVNSKFCVKLGKTATETLRLLCDACRVAVLSSFIQNLMLTRCENRTSILLTAKIATGKRYGVSPRVLPPSGGRAN
jgi:hypothetical protein